MSKQYVIEFIKRALAGHELEAPDFQEAGEFMDVLVTIHSNVTMVTQDKETRAFAANIAWKTCRQMMPKIADMLPIDSKLPAHVKVYGQGSGWSVIHANDLCYLPEATWLIDGKIPESGLTVMYGASGTFKSFIALDYALRIAQEHTVVYMAGEGELGYRIRVDAWCKHHHKTVGNLYLALGAVPIMDNIEVSEFLAVCEPLNPKFIVIDTLARAMVGADENSSRDMGLFLKACSLFQRELGASVLLVHHTNKAGQEERGSGALRGAADSMIRVTALDDEIEVECAKSKDKQPFETENYRFLPLEGTDSGVLVVSEKVVEEADSKSDLTQSQSKVLRAMLEHCDGESTAEAVAELLGLHRGQVTKTFTRLKKSGLISQAQKRDPYTVTPKGRKIMGFDSNDSVDSIDSVDSVDSNGRKPKK